MVKAVFYIPEYFEDKSPIPPERFQDLEEFLNAEFGGHTVAGRVEGAWRNPDTGVVSHDVSVKYEVVLKPDELAALRRFLLQFKEKIGQRAIYFEIDSDAEIEML